MLFSCYSLYKAAEEVRLPKRLRDDLGGSFQEFTSRECHCFAQIKNEDNSYTLFTSQERQWLVLQILQGMRASYDDMDAMQDKGAIVEEGQSIGNYQYSCIHMYQNSKKISLMDMENERIASNKHMITFFIHLVNIFFFQIHHIIF